MTEHHQRPLPAVDDLSRPFWQAAKQHQLVVQRCGECRYFNHPPKLVCDACLSQHLAFEPVSGRGTIYSFSIMHQPNIAGFEEQIPYVNILVALEEQPLLLKVSNLPGSEKDKIRIGNKVAVYFED